MNIIPILKSGDLSKGGNFREISLSSLIAKTFDRMTLNHIRPAIDHHLRKITKQISTRKNNNDPDSCITLHNRRGSKQESKGHYHLHRS